MNYEKITSHLLTAMLLLATMGQAQDDWFVQSPLPTGQDLYAAHFTDSITVWAVGKGGTILKTVNGSWFFPVPILVFPGDGGTSETPSLSLV